MRSLPIVALLAFASPKLAAADCAIVEFSPSVLTPASANLGPHGGVVVAQLEVHQRTTSVASTWHFRSGAHLDAPAITNLAPGLDVFAPRIRGAQVVLEGGDHKALVEVAAAGGAEVELAAPAIAAVKFAESHGRHGSAAGWAELAGDPPAGAVALVAYDKAGKVARSFGTVVTNAKQVWIYRSGDCGGPFGGTFPSKPGDEIRLAWVSASGALSKQTAPIRVGHG